MASDRLAAWRQTHDLGDALGVDASRIPTQYRQQLQQMLDTLPADAAERLLDSLNSRLGDQAFGDQQFIQAFNQAQGEINLSQPAATPGPDPQQRLQQLGVVQPAGTYDLSRQQAGATLTSAQAGAQGAAPNTVSMTPLGYTQPGQTAAAGGPESGQTRTDVLASYLGTSPQQVQRQYQNYVQNFWKHTRAGTTFGGEDVSPLAIGDWVESSLTALEGQNSLILNSYVAWYEEVYGQAMPGDLRQQLRKSLQNLPPNAQAMVNQAIASLSTATTQTAPAQPGAPAGAGLGGTFKATPTAAQGSSVLKVGSSSSLLPFLDQVVSDYATAHPPAEQMQNKVIQARIQQYYQTFNRMPDQATQQQLAGMTDPQFQQMVNNVYTYFNATGQMPSGAMQGRLAGMSQTEMTLWQKNITTLSQAWYDNFGKMPSEQQMMVASTMNGDQLQEYIDRSPSRIGTMNIGQFDGAKKALDPVYTKEFGHSAPDELVAYFHQAQSA